jgi:hypothetical protein
VCLCGIMGVFSSGLWFCLVLWVGLGVHVCCMVCFLLLVACGFGVCELWCCL